MRAQGILALSLVLLAGFSRPVAAVTPDDLVRLTKSGVSDDLILSPVARGRRLCTRKPEDLVALRHQGLSEAVLLAMLKSGREEGEAAFAEQTARAPADQ